jgi:transcriptional regulator with XRE-family HTH domain
MPITNEESKDFNKRLGSVIRRHRELIGLSQEKMAKSIDVSFQQLQKYEHGANRVPCWRLIQIARYIGMTVDDLLREAGEEVSALDTEISSREIGRLMRAYRAAPEKVRKSAVTMLEATANG